MGLKLKKINPSHDAKNNSVFHLNYAVNSNKNSFSEDFELNFLSLKRIKKLGKKLLDTESAEFVEKLNTVVGFFS
ncbi:hypothetical protein [Acinetobacter towneri]|uniref:hypothetical protein n=1 Tax=Acinetobacter towneri TaxID=202956 RepID=UPI00209B99CA|nr:hypothetical protein [Acinetobacter towneri]MCO8056252.1 hypothetical protein [Acinetobacter towneri]